jgi:hypothetical protein
MVMIMVAFSFPTRAGVAHEEEDGIAAVLPVP